MSWSKQSNCVEWFSGITHPATSIPHAFSCSHKSLVHHHSTIRTWDTQKGTVFCVQVLQIALTVCGSAVCISNAVDGTDVVEWQW